MSLATVKAAIHAYITTAVSYHAIEAAGHGEIMEDLVDAIVDAIADSSDAQTLQSVTDNGNETTNGIISGDITSLGGLLDNQNLALYRNSNPLVALFLEVIGPNGKGYLDFFQETGSRSGSLTHDTLTGDRDWLLPNNSGTLALLSDLPAVVNSEYTSATSTSSLTPTAAGSSRDSVILYKLTALAANLTINAPTGTWQDEKILEICIKSSGSYTLTWNAIFRNNLAYTLPAGLATNQVMRAQFNYNSTDSKFDLTGLSIN